VDPNDIYVQHRIDALWEEAARQRLVRKPVEKPGARRAGNRVGGYRVGRILRPVRPLTTAVGVVLVRIGIALGAPPLDNA
jgi:hypothetical protein